MNVAELLKKKIENSEKAEMIIDMINSDITPYLIYLGEKGVAPEVYAVKRDESMECYKFIGPSDHVLVRLVGGRQNYGLRLDKLVEYSSLDELRRVYSKLGFKVGFMCKFPIVHNDLHTANVVVVNGEPFIIDWGKGYLTTPEAHNARSVDSIRDEPDSEMLLDYTEMGLEDVKKECFLPVLKKEYYGSLVKGYESRADFNLEELIELTGLMYNVGGVIFLKYFYKSRFS